MLSKLKDAVGKLNAQIKDVESQLGQAADKVMATLHPDTRELAWYQLGKSRFFTDASYADWKPAIDLHPHTLDVMGDDISRVISPAVSKAAFSLTTAPDIAPWTRPAEIGSGEVGPYWSYAALASLTAECLDNTQVILDQAATILHQVAHDFRSRDRETRDLIQMKEDYEYWLNPPTPRLPNGKPVPEN